MPIRPENRDRYPPDWPEIRARILRRAGNRCERCGVANYMLGGRMRDGRFLPAQPLGDSWRGLQWPRPGTVAWCDDGTWSDRLRIIRIVLTIAHLDHQPENCADDNLRAWCQRCHVTYDAQHHAATARRTRRQPLAIGELFP